MFVPVKLLSSNWDQCMVSHVFFIYFTISLLLANDRSPETYYMSICNFLILPRQGVGEGLSVVMSDLFVLFGFI